MNDILKGLKFILIWALWLLMFFIIGCNSDKNQSETKQQILYKQWKNDCFATIDSFYTANQEQYDSVQLRREIFADSLRINFIDSTTFYFVYQWLQNYASITKKDGPNTFPKIHILRRHLQGEVAVHELAIIFANDTLCKGVNYKQKPFLAEITYLRHDNHKLNSLLKSIDNQNQSQDKRYDDFLIFSTIEGTNINTRLIGRHDSILSAKIDELLYEDE
jgi:hypothetical protein